MTQKVLDQLNRTGGLLVSLSNFLETAEPGEIDILDQLFGAIDHQPGSGLGHQLRDRYPQSPETLAFEQGRFNE
jgi:hypothetical protein